MLEIGPLSDRTRHPQLLEGPLPSGPSLGSDPKFGAWPRRNGALTGQGPFTKYDYSSGFVNLFTYLCGLGNAVGIPIFPGESATSRTIAS